MKMIISNLLLIEKNFNLQFISPAYKFQKSINKLTSFLIQTVLAEWNKPGFSSFYEEMLSRHEEEKRKEAVRQETEELHKVMMHFLKNTSNFTSVESKINKNCIIYVIQRQLIELEVQGIKKDRQRKKRSKNGKLSEIAEKDDSPGDSPKSKRWV